MKRPSFCELVLTCPTFDEAEQIADTLLSKRLVACVEFLEISSKYHWQGKIEPAKEIKLVMTTLGANFDNIKAEIAKLHSYESFALQSLPVAKLPATAAQRLEAATHE